MNAFHYERYRLPNLHNPFCRVRAALFSPILRRLLLRGVHHLIFIRGPTPPAIGTKNRARVIERMKGDARMKKKKESGGRDATDIIRSTYRDTSLIPDREIYRG